MSMSKKFVRITQLDHPDLTKFRKAAILDCGGNETDIELSDGHTAILEQLTDRNIKEAEEIYRYTNDKWYSTEFESVDAFYVDDQIVGISGSKIYGNWMRGAMYYYQLKHTRKDHSTLFFRDGGQLPRLIEHAKELGCYGVFITIWPHSSQLKALTKRMRLGKSIPTPGNLDLIRMMKFKGISKFHGVIQDFYVYEFDTYRFKFDLD